MKLVIRGLLIMMVAVPSLAQNETLQRLLFADVPLAELAKLGEGSSEPPWSNFRKAFQATQAGDTAAARKELLAATSERETRVQLFAWNALRALGVQPDAKEAWTVRGAIVELHNEAGIGAVAVYEDGRARWFAAKGAGGIWESPGENREMTRLIRTMIEAAAPATKTTRPMPHHDTTPVGRDRVRLTVLTYAGFYVIDTYGPELTEQNPITPALFASMAIIEFFDKVTPRPSEEP